MKQYLDQEAIQTKRRHGRRSWGELLAGWLLLLWGITATLSCILAIVPNWHVESHFDKAVATCVVFYGPLCLLGALCSLLRRQTAARRFLASAALCMGAVSVAQAFFEWERSVWERNEDSHDLDLSNHKLSAGLFVASICLFFLARWIGRLDEGPNLHQEDIDS